MDSNQCILHPIQHEGKLFLALEPWQLQEIKYALEKLSKLRESQNAYYERTHAGVVTTKQKKVRLFIGDPVAPSVPL